MEVDILLHRSHEPSELLPKGSTKRPVFLNFSHCQIDENNFTSFSIKDLRDSSVEVCGLKGAKLTLPTGMKSLLIRNLSDCNVQAGPCSGSVFIADCEKCQFEVAGHQVLSVRIL